MTFSCSCSTFFVEGNESHHVFQGIWLYWQQLRNKLTSKRHAVWLNSPLRDKWPEIVRRVRLWRVHRKPCERSCNDNIPFVMTPSCLCHNFPTRIFLRLRFKALIVVMFGHLEHWLLLKKHYSYTAWLFHVFLMAFLKSL